VRTSFEALFGAGGRVGWVELVVGLAAATAISVFIALQRSSLVVMLVSPDLARTAGVNARALNRLAHSYPEMLAISVTCAVVAMVAGSLVAGWLQRDSGPPTVLVASTLFLLSLARRA
jgi:ABC-type Mn2+/Zn2+ transport system permease subunit